MAGCREGLLGRQYSLPSQSQNVLCREACMARAESRLAVSKVAAGSAHLTKGMENWQRACALASAVVLGLTLAAASSAEEQTLTVLSNFKGSPVGPNPVP